MALTKHGKDEQSAAAKRARKDVRTTYRPGLGRLLLLAREDFFQRVERATSNLFDATTLRVCSPMLPFIDESGTRSIDVARRMGVTKQAIAPKIAALVQRGLVECVTDPSDRRAFFVKFTKSGRKFNADVYDAIRRVEHELEDELGSGTLEVLRSALLHMSSWQLQAERLTDGEMAGKAPGGKQKQTPKPKRSV